MMKLLLEMQDDGVRVRIWEGGRRPSVDRVIGLAVAARMFEAVTGILKTYGGFDTYGR